MKRTQISTTTIVGLDIGYGVVKCVTADQTITFPSVMGYARDLKFQADVIRAKYPGDHIKDNDGDWFVGDLAMAQIPAGEMLRLRGRTVNEKAQGNKFRLRLAKVALAKLFNGVFDGDVFHVVLALGLPVDHMADADALKTQFKGQHRIISDVCDVIVNVAEVMVMPQAYGAIYSQMLTASGGINVKHTYQRTGVCDVGTYTVDIALDDDGEFISSESGSVEGGIYVAQERIASYLEREYRQKMPYKVIENVLRTGLFTASGTTISLADEVESALEPVRSATMALLSERWQRGINVDVIYLTGGGAELVYDVVRDAYPQTVLVPQAQLANARGYLQYALFSRDNG